MMESFARMKVSMDKKENDKNKKRKARENSNCNNNHSLRTKLARHQVYI